MILTCTAPLVGLCSGEDWDTCSQQTSAPHTPNGQWGSGGKPPGTEWVEGHSHRHLHLPPVQRKNKASLLLFSISSPPIIKFISTNRQLMQCDFSVLCNYFCPSISQGVGGPYNAPHSHTQSFMLMPSSTQSGKGLSCGPLYCTPKLTTYFHNKVQ